MRTYKVLRDGRRQIAGVHLPRSAFGLENGDVSSCFAEAVTAATILVIKRSARAARAARDNQLATHLWTLTAGEVQRLQDHMLLLSKRQMNALLPSSLKWPNEPRIIVLSNCQCRARA